MKKFKPTFKVSKKPINLKEVFYPMLYSENYFKFTEYKKLYNIVSDTVYDVYIPTPKGWRCIKSNCKTKVRHTHGTYSCLNNKSSINKTNK